jgi:hypothetical protein
MSTGNMNIERQHLLGEEIEHGIIIVIPDIEMLTPYIHFWRRNFHPFENYSGVCRVWNIFQANKSK